ncbi:MAG: hypothetical protein NT157_06060 [Candidatus Micrarchaeota archaeon]|nr:hypothetical protein [Candidatus Micrarchaeota archaeon]
MTQATAPKVEIVAPGIGLVRKITARDAFAQFSILGPKPMNNLAKSNPEGFKRILDLHSQLFMGLSLAPEGPLGDYINSGKLRFSSERLGEKRNIEIPEKNLLRTGKTNILTRRNPLLVITGGCVIERSGNEFSIAFDRRSLEHLADFIMLLTRPSSNGWYKSIMGMPVGKASYACDRDALYFYHFDSTVGLGCSKLGSIWRGNYEIFGGNCGVIVGYMLDSENTVLVRAPDLKQLANEAKTELGKRLDKLPATQQLIKAVRERA